MMARQDKIYSRDSEVCGVGKLVEENWTVTVSEFVDTSMFFCRHSSLERDLLCYWTCSAVE